MNEWRYLRVLRRGREDERDEFLPARKVLEDLVEIGRFVALVAAHLPRAVEREEERGGGHREERRAPSRIGAQGGGRKEKRRQDADGGGISDSEQEREAHLRWQEKIERQCHRGERSARDSRAS